ncbi:hypothetical protein DDZ14_02355 [Maritimibacter sp. 55A14]|uniref:LptF/LptG family permease n=1 Tax=Maritimibacter sp. 55A14 TaxID=2174844 RepID=UPI000D60BB41|nr:LptF/LptG family permease [Maritimibacter sp. 55A14]PWE34024.1 hypothetical protein DDZ14_02355 [Maritimibacter sp. 55A14]
MMHLDRYLSAIFLKWLLITVFAMTTLLGVLDALGNADLLPAGAGFVGQMRYMVLRLPMLFDRILLFALLLSLLLSYSTLIRRNELVPLANAGLSVFAQIRALLPAVILASAVSALFIDQVSPVAHRALERWLGAGVLRDDSRTPETLWLSDARRLVEVEGLVGDTITGVTLYERGDKGRIAAVTRAASASPLPDGWALEDVSQIRFDGSPPKPPLTWQSPQTPETLRLLMAAPRDLALGDLYRLSRMTGSGSQPASAYLVWLFNRLSLPFAATGLLLLAVPLMQRFGRRENSDLALAGGAAIGFVFMVADGVLKTMAEKGTISAVAAVVLPVLALIALGLTLALRRRTLR